MVISYLYDHNTAYPTSESGTVARAQQHVRIWVNGVKQTTWYKTYDETTPITDADMWAKAQNTTTWESTYFITGDVNNWRTNTGYNSQYGYRHEWSGFGIHDNHGSTSVDSVNGLGLAEVYNDWSRAEIPESLVESKAQELMTKWGIS